MTVVPVSTVQHVSILRSRRAIDQNPVNGRLECRVRVLRVPMCCLGRKRKATHGEATMEARDEQPGHSCVVSKSHLTHHGERRHISKGKRKKKGVRRPWTYRSLWECKSGTTGGIMSTRCVSNRWPGSKGEGLRGGIVLAIE